jgi:hypothetical protein
MPDLPVSSKIYYNVFDNSSWENSGALDGLTSYLASS